METHFPLVFARWCRSLRELIRSWERGSNNKQPHTYSACPQHMQLCPVCFPSVSSTDENVFWKGCNWVSRPQKIERSMLGERVGVGNKRRGMLGGGRNWSHKTPCCKKQDSLPFLDLRVLSKCASWGWWRLLVICVVLQKETGETQVQQLQSEN